MAITRLHSDPQPFVIGAPLANTLLHSDPQPLSSVPHWPALGATFRPLSLLLSVCPIHGYCDLLGYLIHGFCDLTGYLTHGFAYGCPIFAN